MFKYFNSIVRIIYQNGYSQEECLKYRPVVFSNTIQSMVAILKAMEPLGIGYASGDRLVSLYFFSIFQGRCDIVGQFQM